MELLAVMTALLIMLFAAGWSSARSYFRKGRLAGMEEATGEIIRGIRSHYETAGQPPDQVSKAIEAIKSFRAAPAAKTVFGATTPGSGFSAMPSAPPAGARALRPASCR